MKKTAKTTKFASAFSAHPLPTVATGEVAGQLLEELGGEFGGKPGGELAGESPDFLLVFVTPSFAGALEDIGATLKTLLQPRVLIGAAVAGVMGRFAEAGNGPGISALAGNVGTVAAAHLDVLNTPATAPLGITGWPNLPWVPSTAFLLADPQTFPIAPLFEKCNEAAGFPRIIGGFVTTPTSRCHFLLDDKVFQSGAVALFFADDATTWINPIVAHGCRPIGVPLIVTKSEGNTLYELAGLPATQRLAQIVRDQLGEAELDLVGKGLFIGRVIDEYQSTFGKNDFAVRAVLDANPGDGSVIVGDRIPVGTTVQFHIFDTKFAAGELHRQLLGRSAKAAFFAGSGVRSDELYGTPHYEPGVIAELLGDIPLVGFRTGGEFASVKGRNIVHGFTASLALFTDEEQ